MKEIQLTQGKVALVDDVDYEWLNQWKWHINSCKCNKKYAVRSYKDNGKLILVYMHREILHTPKGIDTDHINGDGLDNRKSNLRACTHMDNICHQKRTISPTKSSRFKGVYWHKGDKLWRAKITVNRKIIYLKESKDETKAALAYNEAATKYFGEFAILNVL